MGKLLGNVGVKRHGTCADTSVRAAMMGLFALKQQLFGEFCRTVSFHLRQDCSGGF